jgi:hypothetical protein
MRNIEIKRGITPEEDEWDPKDSGALEQKLERDIETQKAAISAREKEDREIAARERAESFLHDLEELVKIPVYKDTTRGELDNYGFTHEHIHDRGPVELSTKGRPEVRRRVKLSGSIGIKPEALGKEKYDPYEGNIRAREGGYLGVIVEEEFTGAGLSENPEDRERALEDRKLGRIVGFDEDGYPLIQSPYWERAMSTRPRPAEEDMPPRFLDRDTGFDGGARYGQIVGDIRQLAMGERKRKEDEEIKKARERGDL